MVGLNWAGLPMDGGMDGSQQRDDVCNAMRVEVLTFLFQPAAPSKQRRLTKPACWPAATTNHEGGMNNNSGSYRQEEGDGHSATECHN